MWWVLYIQINKVYLEVRDILRLDSSKKNIDFSTVHFQFSRFVTQFP